MEAKIINEAEAIELLEQTLKASLVDCENLFTSCADLTSVFVLLLRIDQLWTSDFLQKIDQYGLVDILFKNESFEIIDQIDQRFSSTFLYDRIHKFGIRINGCVNRELSILSKKFRDLSEGTLNDQAQFAYRDLHTLRLHPQIVTVLNDIQLKMTDYASRNRLPTFRQMCHSHINAATQLSGTYDAYIGIMNSGNNIPLLMHALDQNVGFIETHRHWKRDPIWRVPLRNQQGIRRILLSEDDADTGKTLSRVCHKLNARYSDAQIDVIFGGSMQDDSIPRVHCVSHLAEINTVGRFPAASVYTHMLAMRTRLEEKLSKLEN